MNRKLTNYVENPVFSSLDREAFRNIAKHLGNLRLRDAARGIYWWMHNEAWRFSPNQILEKKISRNFDNKFGTDTLRRVDISEMNITGPNASNGVYYQASPVLSTRRVLRDLNISYADFTFIDFGSGKGRTLLLASEFPFRKVIGIEFGEEVHACALRNIDIYGATQAEQVESIHADATTYELPNDNLVLYFFNPFNEVILSKVIRNILDSLSKFPRQAFIIYRYLPDNTMFKEEDGFTLIRDWKRYRVYRWLPSDQTNSMG